MVFQNYAIFPNLNVEENVSYGLRNKGIPKSEHLKLVDEALDLVGLAGYNKRPSNALSELGAKTTGSVSSCTYFKAKSPIAWMSRFLHWIKAENKCNRNFVIYNGPWE